MVYLNKEEKANHLKFLDEQYEKGYIDTELTEYLRQINQLNGICTTQSCTGHRQGKVQDDGQIRLRLSFECEVNFENKLITLLACSNITKIGTMYHSGLHYIKGAIPDGIYQEVCIYFLGANRNKFVFKHSIETILNFLKSIEDKKEKKKMSKVDQLKQWVKDICRWGQFEKFVEIVKDSGEEEKKEKKTSEEGKYEFKFAFNIYTKTHRYRITALDRSKEEGYLGCTMSNRKPRAGEGWTRGRDLPDGKFTKETWDEIKNAIIACELIELAPKEKKMVKEKIEKI